MSLKNRLLFFLLIFLSTVQVHAQNPPTILPNKIITNTHFQGAVSYSWSADTIYVLDGQVVLPSGGQLNIEAGTTIKARDSSYLRIASGAQLFAIGEQTKPITFTTTDTLPPFPSDIFTTSLLDIRGKWAGLILQGTTGQSNGALAYVSIRHAGQILDSTNAGALILEQVDKSTQIHHIEVMCSGNDGIKINGGNINLANVVSFNSTDDGITWDKGWQGNGLFWLVYNGGKKRYSDSPPLLNKSFAIEGRGGIATKEKSNPNIFNATLVGSMCQDGFNGILQLTDQSKGIIANSAFVNFSEFGVQVEDVIGAADSRQEMENGALQISNNLFWVAGDSETGTILVDPNAEDTTASFLVEHLANEKNSLTPSICLNGTQGTEFAFDPRLDTTIIFPDGFTPYPEDSFFNAVSTNGKKGAFPTNDLWILYWTALDEYGRLGEEWKGKYFYKEQALLPKDTLRIQCEEQGSVQDSLIFIKELTPIGNTAQGTTASRRTNNNRRRVGMRSTPEDQLAFIEEWNYFDKDGGCGTLARTLDLVVMIYDTTAPTIHLIPGEGGILSAFAADCDEAWITNTIRDTFVNAMGALCANHTFFAEDYTGNQTSLSVEEKLTGTVSYWYPDFDGDGFGNPIYPIRLSSAIPGFVQDRTDCNDENANAFPGSKVTGEKYNIDYSCDGSANYDICSFAETIELDGIQTAIVLRNSSPSANPNNLSACGTANTTRDIWFKIQIPASGDILLNYQPPVEIQSFPNFTIEWYKGDCQKLQFIACYDTFWTIAEPLSLFVLAEDRTPFSYLYGRVLRTDNINEGALYISAQAFADNNEEPACIASTAWQISVPDSCYQQTFSTALVDDSYTIQEEYCASNATQSLWLPISVPNTANLEVSIDTIYGSSFNQAFLQVYRGDCSALEGIACTAMETNQAPVVLSLDSLIPEERLFLRVSDIGGGEGIFSLNICPQSKMTTSVQDLKKELDLQIYPNPIPSNQPATLQVTLKHRQTIAVSILNVQGQILQANNYTNLPIGTNFLPIQTRGLSSGVYFLQVKAGHNVHALKLIL